jgi:hypothetical protein
MAAVNTTAKNRANRRATAIAVGFDQGVEQRNSRKHDAMILLAIVMLCTAMATHAFAAGGMGGRMGDGVGLGGGHMSGGFHGSIIDQAPSMPAPTFNPSDPYTVPQSPETPVSPASPGSVFGND